MSLLDTVKGERFLTKQMKLYRKFQRSLFVGTVDGSPLFPWEKDPKLYRYPTLFLEFDFNLQSQLSKTIQ